MNRGSLVLAIAAACVWSWANAQVGPGTAQGATGGPGLGSGTIAGINQAALATLNMTEEQRGKVTEIQRGLQRIQWGLMASLRELRWKHQDALNARELDPEAARKRFEAMVAIRREMFEAGLDARLRIEAVLTKEQREELHQRKAVLPEGGSRGAHVPEARPPPR
jgi:Spy/CpxP family protein refolding chaperone